MCTSKALVFLVFALIDVTRDNNKANYLAGMLSSLVFASVLPMLGGGLHLAFPNNVRAGALQVTAGGVVYLQALLASVHRGMQSSWGQAWESMFAAGLLSSSWQAELPLVDVCLFLAQVSRFRRSQVNNRRPWGQTSQLLHGQLVDMMVTFISTCLVEYLALVHMSQVDVSAAAAPARRFRIFGLGSLM